MAVYAIQAGGPDGLVKIGKADDPKNRLKQLQIGHAEKLKLIRQWQGGEAEEAALHAQFDAVRVRGEWFSVTLEMLDGVTLAEIVKPERPEGAPLIKAGEECLAVLKSVFKDRGFKQRDIARHLGVSEPTVSHWVSGRQVIPCYHILPLARLLRVPAEALLPASEAR